MTRNRTAWSALAGAAVLAAAVLSASGATAAAPQAGIDTDPAVKLGAALGARSAGTYLDAGKVVVTVTDAATAAQVRAVGGTPKLVARDAATLARAESSLAGTLRSVAGTAWGVDARTNQVLVSVDSSVKGAQLAAVRAAVAQAGAAARLEAVPGTFSRLISGGQAIYASGGRCSLGFNVRSGSTDYFLTAGHCTEIGATWYANSARTTVLGTRAGSSFPVNDYGIVRYTNASIARPGNVWLYSGSTTQDITRSANATVGQAVRRSGSTTGLRSGTVTALNQTVNYGGGDVVSGLIRTTVCAEPGDSGGSLFAGTTALGLTSGGSGNCSSGGTTYFQPVVEALNAYGVAVY